MNALERLSQIQRWTEQLAQSLLHERHMRRALRDQLLADVASELALEADLLARASASSPPAFLDDDYLADRSRLRRSLDELALTPLDGPRFDDRASAVMYATMRHGHHQERWLLPFLATRLVARDAA